MSYRQFALTQGDWLRVRRSSRSARLLARSPRRARAVRRPRRPTTPGQPVRRGGVPIRCARRSDLGPVGRALPQRRGDAVHGPARRLRRYPAPLHRARRRRHRHIDRRPPPSGHRADRRALHQHLGHAPGDRSLRHVPLTPPPPRCSLGAYDNQDVPFEAVLEELQPPRDLSRTPLFQTYLNLLNYNADPKELPLTGLGEPRPTSAKFDLSLYATTGDDAVQLTLVYATALFEHDTAAALLSSLQHLVTGAVSKPDLAVGDLPLTAASCVTPSPRRPRRLQPHRAGPRPARGHTRRLHRFALRDRGRRPSRAPCRRHRRRPLDVHRPRRPVALRRRRPRGPAGRRGRSDRPPDHPRGGHDRSHPRRAAQWQHVRAGRSPRRRSTGCTTSSPTPTFGRSCATRRRSRSPPPPRRGQAFHCCRWNACSSSVPS